MASVPACFVLIPAPTLEDFPKDFSDLDARSLLAAWTVMWHPKLIAYGQQIPQWHRADAPPEQADLVMVPRCSLDQLPSGYQEQFAQRDNALWVCGTERRELEEQVLAGMGWQTDSFEALSDCTRTLEVADFYAVGFAYLQVQVMTRRLRYTSNLDEIHLENQLVLAAEAFLGKRTDEAISALHEVFDALAQERDHYFASDPHLIDLALINDGTLDAAIDSFSAIANDSAGDAPAPGQHETPLPIRRNVLIDSSAIDALSQRADDSANRFREQIGTQQIGSIAGAPGKEVRFDTMGYTSSVQAIETAHARAAQCIGASPRVYGRLDGDTPSDLMDVIAKLGYVGVVPINFAAGSGFEQESKVTISSAHGDLEALTAKPIDAASDASFLDIGAKLGEAIDSGEVATGLMVHWPGHVCESFRDLQRVASWSVVLGKFWTVEDYFVSGEKPYHESSLSIATGTTAERFAEDVHAGLADPISSHSDRFRKALDQHRDGLVQAMDELVSGVVPSDEPPIDSSEISTSSLAGSIGTVPSDNAAACLVVNPYSAPIRVNAAVIDPTFPASWAGSDHLFAASRGNGSTVDTTVDVPNLGYAIVGKGIGDNGPAAASSTRRSDAISTSSPLQWLRDRFLGKPSTIASRDTLHNEFMEIVIDEKTGSLASVFSGGQRGNRYSMRLVAVGEDQTAAASAKMIGDSLSVTQSSAAIGQIRSAGRIATAESELAAFEIFYTLQRGSRVIDIDIHLEPKVELGDDPWRNYFAARSAVVDESALVRCLIRDKIHHTSRRRMVAPLGLLIDEVERKTLICGHGAPYHRAAGHRFFDTLIQVKGETNQHFKLSVGIDVPHPLITAKSLISPPIVQQVEANSSIVPVGWFAHLSPSSVVLESLKVHALGEGRLAAEVRLIQTTAKSCQAKLRFFREVAAAMSVSGDCQTMLKQWSDGNDKFTQQSLEFGGDVVELAMQGHAVTDALVIFR